MPRAAGELREATCRPPGTGGSLKRGGTMQVEDGLDGQYQNDCNEQHGASSFLGCLLGDLNSQGVLDLLNKGYGNECQVNKCC